MHIQPSPFLNQNLQNGSKLNFENMTSNGTLPMPSSFNVDVNLMPSQHPSFLNSSVYINHNRKQLKTIEVLTMRKKITEIAVPLLKKNRNYVPRIIENQAITSPLGSYRPANGSTLSRFQHHRIPTTQELKISSEK